MKLRAGRSRWCGVCRSGLLIVFAWRKRRWSGACGCLAWLLGLLGCAWLASVVLRLLRRRGRDRFAPPDGDIDPTKRPMPVQQRVPAKTYRRPDPLIYCQTYLMAQGVAVTWDNPDIRLERKGKVVPSHALKAGTDYEIVARVWNGSDEAPAIDLPVRFSYLEFGIGTVRHELGVGKVDDLPVKGAPGLPAFARFGWKTPSAPGHYCLQVELEWPDDANPANNLGQENTDVQALNSPRARFVVPVRNDAPVRRRLTFEVDSYAIGELAPCPPGPRDGDVTSARAREAHRRRALARHTRGAHPVPEGWTVEFGPEELTLSPGEQIELSVEVVAPDGFEGRQGFNLNAFAEDRLVGGVTLTAEGKA